MSVPRDALRAGTRESAGIPAITLAAGYIGFGALAAFHFFTRRDLLAGVLAGSLAMVVLAALA